MLAFAPAVRFGATSALLMLAPLGCAPAEPLPDRTELRQPGGLALSADGRWLFVTAGNFDLMAAAGAALVCDVDRWLDGAEVARAGHDDDRCWRRDDGTPECSASAMVEASHTVFLGQGLAHLTLENIAPGVGRLLVTQRFPPAIGWVDVQETAGSGLHLDCGQDDRGRCSEAHLVTSMGDDGKTALPADPARVVVDGDAKLGYVPHLTGSALSLLRLDEALGPRLTSVTTDFFTVSPAPGFGLAGGFSVVRRACDEADPIAGTEGCSRHFLYASERFWPGLRGFMVAPGLEQTVRGDSVALGPTTEDAAPARPTMGDLAFEDDAGKSLLVVQTTPPALLRVNTTLDVQGRPRNTVEQTAALCPNPNALEVYETPRGQRLALVTCFGDGQLAVVGLSTFTVIATVPLGAGANEMAVDAERRLLFVANTRDDSLSAVSLDDTSPMFLREVARLRHQR